jgi:hypothetical protein
MSINTTDIPPLTELVAEQKKDPTIVNPDSNFVVVTYWWGRGNDNSNIARPCLSFYETFATQISKYTLKYLTILYSKSVQDRGIVMKNNPELIVKNMPTHVSSMKSFVNMIKYFAKTYIDGLYADVNLLDNKDTSRFSKAKQIIEQMKRENTCPAEFNLLAKSNSEFQFQTKVDKIFRRAARLILETNAKSFIQIIRTKGALNLALKNYREGEDEQTKQDTLKLIKMIGEKGNQYVKEAKNNIKTKNTIIDAFGEVFENSSVIDVLNHYLRHRSSMKFQDMIARWEQTCAAANCNYLAVEYDYFSRNKLYQLAINAKPLFIKHALKLCQGRAVVYIDGDMFIRKYPKIFDMQNIDFMSRGWNIDPRSSYNIGTSIMFNPYKFETSGGIMYFSNSTESIKLMDMWIDESAKPSNSGKADDRILSIVFNAQKFLLNMTTIQLPIEYLWLTLDYDDRMLEHIYDWDKNEMDATIFIDHPECLTSEETAEGSGASSDRSPKLHKFLDSEEDDIPASEEFHEYFMFPSQEMADQFKPYHAYMSETQYIDDGNPILYEKKLVDRENKANNEYPMYITSYNKQYGKRQNIVNNNMNIAQNELNDTYWSREKGLQIIKTTFKDDKTILLCEGAIPGEEYTIPMIISLINRGYSVIYLPSTCKDKCYLSLVNDKRSNLELIFMPDIPKSESIFKPVVDMTQPIYFKQQSELSLLTKALAMYPSLEEFAYSFAIGNYQVMSRIRIGYVFKNKKNKPDANILSFCSSKTRSMITQQVTNPKSVIVAGGSIQYGAGISQDQINAYIEGQSFMYGAGLRNNKKVSKVVKIKRNTKKTTKSGTAKKWSAKYKRSINCKKPKGFSQKQYCKHGRKNTKRKH